MKIDVDKLNDILDNFISDRDWDQFHSIKNLTMALSVETSELVEIFQWLTEEDSNKVVESEKLKLKVEEELADIFIYLLRIAKKTNVDLGKVVLSKIKRNSEKYPVEKSRGSSKKYTDL